MSETNLPRRELDDALDRILLGDDVVEPSPGFRKGVMEAVRDEAEAPAPIAFPWRLFGFAAAIFAALCLVVILGMDPASVPDPSVLSTMFARVATSQLILGLGIALAGVLGSLTVAWASVAASSPRTLRIL